MTKMRFNFVPRGTVQRISELVSVFFLWLGRNDHPDERGSPDRCDTRLGNASMPNEDVDNS